MPKYVDGYVLPIPKNKVSAYRKMAVIGAKLWMDHGALRYCESVGDDLVGKFGMTFPRGIRIKRGETVIFAWVVFKSRAHRDRVNAKVMKDPRLQAFKGPMPFDPKRMMVGGFKVIVEA